MRRPKAVGVHIYSGAFSVGVQRAGFELAGVWEEGPWGAATFELNFPNVHHPLERKGWPVKGERDVVMMYANPPCAPWSLAGSRRGMADPRVAFTDHCVEAALAVEPDFFVWESVCQAFKTGRKKVDQATRRFNRRGYAVTVLMTNSVLHGAPQWRDRFHLIAHRYELDLRVPLVGYGDVATTRQAIEDLENSAVSSGQEERVPNHVYEQFDERGLNVVRRIQEGEGWDVGYERAVAEGVPAKKARYLAGRMTYDAPSRTIADVACMVHPVLDRMITIREAARLCGYPDTFVFAPEGPRHKGFNGVRREDVTQAVMPPVGEFLGRTFLRALDSGREATPGRGFELVDWRPLARPFSPKRFVDGTKRLEGERG